MNSLIPFVTACGGHSAWSTIDNEGFVLDLSLYKDVALNPSSNTATVKGGVLMKELQVALNKEGRFTSILHSHISMDFLFAKHFRSCQQRQHRWCHTILPEWRNQFLYTANRTWLWKYSIGETYYRWWRSRGSNRAGQPRTPLGHSRSRSILWSCVGAGHSNLPALHHRQSTWFAPAAYIRVSSTAGKRCLSGHE